MVAVMSRCVGAPYPHIVRGAALRAHKSAWKRSVDHGGLPRQVDTRGNGGDPEQAVGRECHSALPLFRRVDRGEA